MLIHFSHVKILSVSRGLLYSIHQSSANIKYQDVVWWSESILLTYTNPQILGLLIIIVQLLIWFNNFLLVLFLIIKEYQI